MPMPVSGRTFCCQGANRPKHSPSRSSFVLIFVFKFQHMADEQEEGLAVATVLRALELQTPAPLVSLASAQPASANYCD